MANSWFQFKQFTIQQDRTAMKVCTDSCVFGVTVPVDENIKTILDIGTGTGLLSLMLAQRTSSSLIDAVELNADAAQQATDNFFHSSWKERLTLYETSIQDYFKFTTKQYDLIVCNPPFFSGSIKTGNEAKDMALHQSRLSVEELMQVTFFMLAQKGDAYMLISIYEEDNFLKAAAAVGLKGKRYMSMYDNGEKLIRYIIHFRKDDIHIETEEIKFVIRNSDNQYTAEFVDALKDFYLHL
jgi:tRNA1Val (adenine37-N6)-methyltransferase